MRTHSQHESPAVRFRSRHGSDTPSNCWRTAAQHLTSHSTCGIGTADIEMLTRLFAAMGAATQTEANAAAHGRGLITGEPSAHIVGAVS
jgi:hypothetical protein